MGGGHAPHYATDQVRGTPQASNGGGPVAISTRGLLHSGLHVGDRRRILAKLFFAAGKRPLAISCPRTCCKRLGNYGLCAELDRAPQAAAAAASCDW